MGVRAVGSVLSGPIKRVMFHCGLKCEMLCVLVQQEQTRRCIWLICQYLASNIKYETARRQFLIGQHTMVNVDIESLKQLKLGHGGFNDTMEITNNQPEDIGLRITPQLLYID